MAQKEELKGPDFADGVAFTDLPEGTPVLGQARGEAIVMVRSGTEVCAVAARCSHYGGPLHEGLVVGSTLRCPWHHARFDLRTGDAVGAPALSSIACYEVHRHGDRVRLGSRKAPPKPASSSAPRAVVIVGAGAAGAAAAEQLRRLGCSGSIVLLGEELPGPVDRPNLSKDYLAGTAPEDWIPLRPRSFYQDIEVDLRIGDVALAVDATGRTVTLASGQVLPYDALLLATGAEPVRLRLDDASGHGAAPPVFTLRTLADARAIIAATGSAQRAVVIGASFIGLEAAAALRARGLEVDVVGREQVPLERVLGPELGRYVQRLHEEHGVRFHLGASPRAAVAHGVELEDGRRLPADLLVLGVGVRPRTALAEKAGLRVDRGIVVDEFLRSSVSGIWAAGDAVRYPEARLGTPVRIEHWVVAQRQGQAAARDMLGRGTPFIDVPFFWSQHYDVTLAYSGHAESWDEVVVLGSLENREATVLYRSAGRVDAVVTVGRDRQSLAVEAALEGGATAALAAALET